MGFYYVFQIIGYVREVLLLWENMGQQNHVCPFLYNFSVVKSEKIKFLVGIPKLSKYPVKTGVKEYMFNTQAYQF